MSIEIKEISQDKVWPLRHRIMYPDQPFESIKLPNDEKGIHFGLFVGHKLVSVVSLFLENNKVQFRKLATEIAVQKKGYGSQLLMYIISYALDRKAESIWCNARKNKYEFYQKFGMVKTDKSYTKGGISFVIMEKPLNQ